MFEKFFSKKDEPNEEPLSAEQARKASEQALKDKLPLVKVLAIADKHIQKATKKGERKAILWNRDIFGKDFILSNDYYLIELRDALCENLISRGFKTNIQSIQLYVYW